MEITLALKAATRRLVRIWKTKQGWRDFQSPADYPEQSLTGMAEKVYDIDLAPYFQRHRKPEFSGNPRSYLYEVRIVTGYHLQPMHGIYTDGYHTFVLMKFPEIGLGGWRDYLGWDMYLDGAVACVGFDLIPRNAIIPVPAVRIVQLQGVKTRQEALDGIRWERLLINLVVDWARSQGYSRVEVQAAKNNRWRGRGAVSDTALKMRYDVTAKRCGFEYDPANDAYALPVQQAS